jgi:hypothetical protein
LLLFSAENDPVRAFSGHVAPAAMRYDTGNWSDRQ